MLLHEEVLLIRPEEFLQHTRETRKTCYNYKGMESSCFAGAKGKA